ncbi:TIGR03016 family PEP-CTERM system-associated outer membrane protein [Roseateles oligotrophus]|uniref:TIGR03016 family PEP-CTERM system-associated outer membrane protein n=1 Tax=Roseateles oligotrophus TaxID=1769250 RepID=A0ABT2YF96_9BURK|nr:TIGR03016 family PEP-CTERM system-associated outer membrane protein [Roseateles oligotrophus]MCV2368726.1 TIGR03016 family PEP-CTERM system-associated outer membrane protein [Roseateles oligotrophus]
MALALTHGASIAQLTGLGIGIGAVGGGEAGGVSSGPGFRVQPRISLTQTWTDNLSLNDAAKDAALITVLAPGISVSSSAGRLRGSLDYSLNGLLYTKTDLPNDHHHSLSANGTLELIERSFFVDARASYGQQQQSAFGQQTSAENAIRNPNSSDTASLSVSPRLLGRLGNIATYQLSGNVTETKVKDSIAGDSRITSISLNSQGLASGPLNWTASATTQNSSFDSGKENSRSSATAGLSYRPDVDLTFSGNAGMERSDLQTGSRQAGPTYGLNAQWTPTPRTSVQGNYQGHDYGDSHTISFNHRFQRSSIRFSDTSNVSQGFNSQGGQQTNYSLFFFQFESKEPDPVKRDLLVRQFLLENGLNPNAAANSGFVSSSPSLQRRQELSGSWQGLRTTVTTTLSQSRNSRIGAQVPGSGDLSQSSLVQERNASATLAYRLTPTSSTNLTVSGRQIRGQLASQSSTLRTINASWNGRLGNRGSVSVGTRYSLFEGPRPYRENAVFATLVHQF